MPVLALRLYEGTRQLLINPFCQGSSLLVGRLGLQLDQPDALGVLTVGQSSTAALVPKRASVQSWCMRGVMTAL